MRRNLVVLTAIVAALALMVAAGVINYRQRQRARQARVAAMKMPLAAADSQYAAPPSTADQQAALDQSAYTTPLNGHQAPNFTLEDTSGKQVSLASLKGHPVVVDFWATWCGPCKVEIPWFEKLQQQYAGQGLRIIGVSADDLDKDDPAKLFTEKRDISDFATKMHMNYPVLYDAASVADSWGGLDALPTTFFIDRTGKIVASTVGVPSENEIQADIQKVIGATS